MTKKSRDRRKASRFERRTMLAPLMPGGYLYEFFKNVKPLDFEKHNKQIEEKQKLALLGCN